MLAASGLVCWNNSSFFWLMIMSYIRWPINFKTCLTKCICLVAEAHFRLWVGLWIKLHWKGKLFFLSTILLFFPRPQKLCGNPPTPIPPDSLSSAVGEGLFICLFPMSLSFYSILQLMFLIFQSPFPNEVWQSLLRFCLYSSLDCLIRVHQFLEQDLLDLLVWWDWKRTCHECFTRAIIMNHLLLWC